jgi:uncharacterized protein YjdB
MRVRSLWPVVTVAMLVLLSWFGGCTQSEGIGSIPAVVKVSPDTLTILTGQSAQLTATAWDANGKELAARAVTWSSRHADVAAVSSSGVVTGLVLGRDTITAIVNGISGTASVTVLSPTLASVTVSPESTGVPSNGTLQLSATLDDGNGHRIVNGPVTWATHDPSVATVSRTGLVTAVDSGRDTITALSGGRTGVAILDVRGYEQPSGSGILVSDLAPKPTPQAQLASPSLHTAGLERSSTSADSVTYVAIPPGTVPDGATAQMFNPSSGSLVTAAMNAGGLDPVPVGAKAGDTVTVVTTTTGGVSSTIRAPVSSDSPPIVIRTEPGKKKTDVPLNSVMAFVFSEPVDLRTISAQTIELVKNGQLVPGHPVLQSGGLRVDFIPDAQLDPQSTYTLIVTTAVRSLKGQPLQRAEVSTFSTGTSVGGLSFVFVTPTSAAIVVGGAIQLTATPADTFGDPIRADPVTWSTNNANVAVVSSSGLVTAVGPGQAVIRATANGVSGQSIIQVVPPTSLIIDGVWDWTERIVATSVTCNDTGSYAFTQIGVTFTGQSQQVGTCSTPGDNARTDPVTTGLINGSDISFGVGSGGNTCSYTGHVTGSPASAISGSISCSDGSTGTWAAVRKEPVASVAVTPAAVSLFPGIGVQLSPALLDAQGHSLFFRAITWASDRPSVANVDVRGFATGVDTGSATISATAEGTIGTSSVRVNPHVASVKVTPTVDSIAIGATAQFTAVPKDAAGNPIPGLTTSWWSTNPTVATVSTTGLATGGAAGSTLIGAAVENGGGTATLVVTGSPVTIGGQWSFAQEFDSTDQFGDPFVVCADSGSLALTQNGFAFTGTSSQVGSCADETPRQLTNGTISGLVLTYDGGGCRYTVTASPAGDAFSGSGTCANAVTVTIQAHRSGTPVALRLQPSTVALLSGFGAQLTAALVDSVGSSVFGFRTTWSSDNTTVAPVSAGGVVTGAAGGTATVTATSDGFTATAAVTVTALRFSAVSAGLNTSCGVTTVGEVWCWGAVGPTYTLIPVKYSGALNFNAVSAGHWYACGLTAAGAAYCWGDNSSGQLGDGSTTSRSAPVPVSGGLTFTTVSASRLGYPYTCGLTTSGAAYCWGYNGYGQLGNGTTISSATPVAVSGGLTFTSISAGGNQTCAGTANGTVYCWGGNTSGELGNGTFTPSAVPVAVSGGLSFTSVTTGTNHTCGLTMSGAAYCWGATLGIGAGPSGSATPLAVVGGLTYAALSAGAAYSCGIALGGTVYCWGALYSDSPSSNIQTDYVPTAAPGGLSFTAVTVGGHTCGIASDGFTYCWGYNYEGELGILYGFSSTSPVRVVGQQ